jgi:hypothetical protein
MRATAIVTMLTTTIGTASTRCWPAARSVSICAIKAGELFRTMRRLTPGKFVFLEASPFQIIGIGQKQPNLDEPLRRA